MMILAKRFFLVFIFSLISCSSPNNNSIELDIISIKGSTMGTSYNIKYSSEKKDSSEVEIVHKEIKKILKNINLEMSTYIPESEISKFNSSKSTEWFNISKDFFYVVKQSFKYNELSDGRYDITVQPLVNLWGFGPEKFLNPPTEAEIDSVKQFVGQNLIEINDGKLRKKDSRVQLDLSSIAKGFAVDKIFNYLENHDEVFVEIGGEIRTKSTIKDWKIGINTPSINNFSNDIEKIISLNNLSIATSGNYRNYFIYDDKFYHHEIDIKTGEPVQSQIGSISIISEESCMDADALSTMYYTMKLNEISDSIKKFDKLESLVILVNNDGTFIQIPSEKFPKN